MELSLWGTSTEADHTLMWIAGPWRASVNPPRRPKKAAPAKRAARKPKADRANKKAEVIAMMKLRQGRDLRWDPKQERVLGGHAANQMLSRPMCKAWAIHLS